MLQIENRNKTHIQNGKIQTKKTEKIQKNYRHGENGKKNKKTN